MKDSQALAIRESKLPALKDLYDQTAIEKWEKDNALHVLLNQPANPKWLEPHPFAKRKVRQSDGSTKDEKAVYLPIARQEWLMTRIFINWYVEILDWKLVANSVGVTVRVHYQNPIDGQWKHTDGLGAVALQTDAGAGATDFMKLKSSSVQMALPAAESYAFKDAVEKLGNIFGKDANRLDPINYDGMLETFETPEKAMREIELKIIKGFSEYKGSDKDKLFADYQRDKKDGKFDQIYAEFLARKIGVTL